jgi:hypothetical protein
MEETEEQASYLVADRSLHRAPKSASSDSDVVTVCIKSRCHRLLASFAARLIVASLKMVLSLLASHQLIDR